MGSPPSALAASKPSRDEALPLAQDDPPPVANPDDSAYVDAAVCLPHPQLLGVLPHEDGHHLGVGLLPPHPLPLLDLSLPYCCLPKILPPLQADVWAPLQWSLVCAQLLGAPRQLEAGLHRLAEHQALPRPLLLGRLQMVRRQHAVVGVGRQLVELFRDLAEVLQSDVGSMVEL